ncbi:C-type mannose receptor 2-like [Lacerta agilis]|uniref:C-type mannose receptor 2-like n=1 Tax=Lacerta agilis TaxID=80427 RepID=UPI001419CF78|nr:C-type mannose receptor 2-like [Lacerta agilis]
MASLLSSDREYFLIQDPQTMLGAHCYCLRQGSRLAGFRDDRDMEQAASLCPNCSFWIGLYRQGLSWVWLNSDPYKFTQWSPASKTSESCAVMNESLWYQEKCLQKHPFVCCKGPAGALPFLLQLLLNCRSIPDQKDVLTPALQSTVAATSLPTSKCKIIGYLVSLGDAPATTDGNELPSPTAVQDLSSTQHRPEQETRDTELTTFSASNLTKVGPLQDQSPVVIQENRTWFEALAACHARGRILAGRVALQQGLMAWLGLHRHGLWGYWVWANGSAVEEPQSWREGEPNDPLWGNCGAGTGTEEGVLWEDECCEQKLYYVCE